MISFALRCAPHGHRFDGWFRSGDDFDRQAGRRLVECPVCGSTEISKALMKPAIAAPGRSRPAADQAVATSAAGPATAAGGAAVEPVPPPSMSAASLPGAGGRGFANTESAAKVIAQLHAITRELRAKADYVGPKFAEEARRIHYGEAGPRRIYGEATRQEVESLGEEGIGAVALPSLPEDHN